jgi:hypothetical protein
MLAAAVRPMAAGSGHSRDEDLPSDWRAFLDLAGRHLVTPAVAWTLRNRRDLPEWVAEYLESVLCLSRQRAERTLGEIEFAVGRLNAKGIRPVILKGGAALVEELYPDAGARLLMDIDLLVPEPQVPRAVAALAAAGFAAHAPQRRWVTIETHDLPTQIHASWPVGIEIHRRLLPRIYPGLVEPEAVIASAEPVCFRGTEALLPHPSDRIAHHVAHSHVMNGEAATGIPQMRLLLELALIIRRHADGADWAEIDRRFSAQGRRAALTGALSLCGTLLGQWPTASSREDRADCGTLLALERSLADPRRVAWARARTVASIYLAQLRLKPLALLNLVHPVWWPARVRGIAARVRGGAKIRRLFTK